MNREHVCPDCGLMHLVVQQCYICENTLPNNAWWYYDGYEKAWSARGESEAQLVTRAISGIETLLRALDPTLAVPENPAEVEQKRNAQQRLDDLRQLLGQIRPGGY